MNFLSLRWMMRVLSLVVVLATCAVSLAQSSTPAGRSPLPQPGESFDKPIEFKVLMRTIDGQVPLTGLAPPATLPEAKEAEDFDLPTVSWDEAHDYLGTFIVAKGKVVTTRNIGNFTFLNFHEDWREKFYVVVYQQAYKDIPGRPENAYLNKTILVTGRVDVHRGRPQIKVFEADQIEIVAE